MRLICPNCDAQYEVADEVIPAEGRDVQCSDCGQTWYQYHADHMPQTEAPNDAPDEMAEPADIPAKGEERARAPDPVRRELHPSIADILREEAALEAKARAQTAQPLESQPDLGLDDTAPQDHSPADTDRALTARLRGEDPEPEPETEADHVSEATATAAALGSRRDLLPDIEEINSTLRSTSDRHADSERGPASGHATKGNSGFRRGFTLMILLAVILVAIYKFAPQIAQAAPQVDPYLSAFVAHVDTARSLLDGHVVRFLGWLDAVATAQNGTH